MSLFGQIPDQVPDNTFATIEAFRENVDEKKVNLSPGLYCDESATPWVLPAVKKAREIILADPNFNHDISSQLGYPEFILVARQFFARLMSDTLRPRTVWLSDPTWENHTKIWTHVNADIEQRYYPYYDYETSTLDIEGMLSALKSQAAGGDVLILHACAHNPTGLDPSREQWQRIAEICQEKKIFPFFESFSKNFGLYGERVGALHVVTSDRDTADRVEKVLRKISRAEISSTPSFGAKIVATIVQNPDLREQWHRDMKTMSNRLGIMRRRLYEELTKRGPPGNWDHLLTDIGMFSMTGLSPEKVKVLRDTFHIYLFPTGRLSFTGLTESNVDAAIERHMFPPERLGANPVPRGNVILTAARCYSLVPSASPYAIVPAFHDSESPAAV
ncbi:hypothetical protein EKO27_g585 [Xylaria grammica]|uniref:Aspartate aminotransferase n=1 Tax=Xylaria grammica TaxID=363999 RepID=A0A439DJF4_9PEZI|nr:hypothetical protein EKO27_g585 [Xylaria grammica]